MANSSRPTSLSRFFTWSFDNENCGFRDIEDFTDCVLEFIVHADEQQGKAARPFDLNAEVLQIYHNLSTLSLNDPFQFIDALLRLLHTFVPPNGPYNVSSLDSKIRKECVSLLGTQTDASCTLNPPSYSLPESDATLRTPEPPKTIDSSHDDPSSRGYLTPITDPGPSRSASASPSTLPIRHQRRKLPDGQSRISAATQLPPNVGPREVSMTGSRNMAANTITNFGNDYSRRIYHQYGKAKRRQKDSDGLNDPPEGA